MRKIIIIAILLASFSSCIKDVDYKLDFEGSKMMVFSEGYANQTMKVFLTRTFQPLTNPENPDSLVVKNALIKIYENNMVVDTMKFNNRLYKSNIILKQGYSYRFALKTDNNNEISTKNETIPFPAYFIDGNIDLVNIDSSEYLPVFYFDTELKIKKSKNFPFNEIYVDFFFKQGIKRFYYYLSSNSDFIECDGCFNILNNPCVENLNGDIVVLKNNIEIDYSEYKISDLDSIKFYLTTYSDVADKLCRSGIDFEEYYGNPLPFASNPSTMFSNIEGGYGLFILGATDTLTVKL